MAWFNRLLNALRGDRLSSDIDRELAFHLAEKADELKARGFSDEAALHEARRRFGNYTNQKEQTRAVNLHAWLDTLSADLRYALTKTGSPSVEGQSILRIGADGKIVPVDLKPAVRRCIGR